MLDKDEYVTKEEFQDYCITNELEHKRIMDALWGTRGDDSGSDTAGMVRDIAEIKNRLSQIWKISCVVGGLVTPIITAFIIKILLNNHSI